MTSVRLAFASLSLFLFGSFAQAQIVQKKGGYLFLVKYKKGQVIKQNMSMQALGNTKLKSSSQFITKCLDIQKDGVATLEVTVPAVGKTPAKRKKVKVDNHGKPQGASIDGFSGNFVWPDKPVKVGQSWIGDMNMASPGQGGGMAFKSTYKLTGIKKINGVKVATISSDMKVSGTYDISGTGIIYVRFSDGQLHSAEFHMALAQFSESNTRQQLKLLMTIRTPP